MMTFSEQDAERRIGLAIAEHYDRLSTGQRRVIDRLLADAAYGAVVSAPELARETGVSEATVTRAAQTLGFAGYPDLQRHLRARFIQPVQDRVAVQNRESEHSPAMTIMLEDAENIQRMAEHISQREIEDVVDALVGARRVFVIGVRGSHGLAEMLGIGLRLILPDVQVLNTTSGDLPDQLIGLGSQDTVVAISFRRVDTSTVNVLTWANEVGARTVGISDHRSSMVARLARHSLVASIGTLRLLPSFAPGASLINAILAELAARQVETAEERMRNAEALWQRFGSYAED